MEALLTADLQFSAPVPGTPCTGSGSLSTSISSLFALHSSPSKTDIQEPISNLQWSTRTNLQLKRKSRASANDRRDGLRLHGAGNGERLGVGFLPRYAIVRQTACGACVRMCVCVGGLIRVQLSVDPVWLPGVSAPLHPRKSVTAIWRVKRGKPTFKLLRRHSSQHGRHLGHRALRLGPSGHP